jgi:hypothetical protein
MSDVSHQNQSPMNISLAVQDGNQTKPTLYVRFYRMRLRKTLIEGDMLSVFYLLLVSLIRYQGYTHVGLRIRTPTLDNEYGLSWYGISCNPTQEDYTLELKIPNLYGMFGTYASYIVDVLSRIHTLSVPNYYVSLHDLSKAYL